MNAIEVTSGDHRPAAHAFYRAAGYQADERRFVQPAPAWPPEADRSGGARRGRPLAALQ